MLIKLADFNSANYEDIKIIANTDNGLFAVQYEKQPKAESAELQVDRGWHYDDTKDYYTLTVPQAKRRKVLRSVMIARTSTNHYEIAYGDAFGCVFANAKNLATVHQILTRLWERKLEQ